MTTETAAAPHTGTSPAGDDAHEQHGASDRTYIVLAVVLAVITALEVSWSYLDVGAFMLPGLIIMMIAKFTIVVSYFMHLKWEQRLFKWLFYTGVFLAIGVYLFALATFHFFAS